MERPDNTYTKKPSWSKRIIDFLRGWFVFYGYKKFPRSVQLDDYSCGAHAAYMILQHFGKDVGYLKVKKALGTDHDGTTPTALRRVLRSHGLTVKHQPAQTKWDLRRCLKTGGVAIAEMDGDHYAVVHGMKKNGTVFVADPSMYRSPGRKHSPKKFKARWCQWALMVHAA